MSVPMPDSGISRKARNTPKLARSAAMRRMPFLSVELRMVGSVVHHLNWYKILLSLGLDDSG